MSDFQRALHMLERFEKGDRLLPAESGTLIANILRACGHTVVEQGFAESDSGVDCFFESDIDGKRSKIAVEVKSSLKPAEIESVEQALRMKDTGHFDRAMVVSRSGFSRTAFLEGLAHAGAVDLFGPAELRNWLSKFEKRDSVDESCIQIVRKAMRSLALRLAERPDELPTVEWRSLEHILREAFEGLGYDTTLTRSGKDGGFDLELATSKSGSRQVFLVEVKHWLTGKPGLPHLKKLIEVTASRNARGSLFLSTSGFARTVYSGLASFESPVRLGDGDKVISLCRTYYRLNSGFLLESPDLEETLFSGTTKPGTFAP